MSTDTIDLAPPQACTIEAPAHPALRRLFQRLRRPTRSDLAVGGIALLAGILYVWALGSVGSGNSYYAAAVKAATKSWRAFFLVSSPGESHPRALAEPYVTVSRHTAPTSRLRMRENAPSASVHPSALPRAGWPRADLTCPAPFAPAPLQGLHRYYGPVRPCASRYSASCGVRRLGVSLLRPGGNLHPFRLVDGFEATGSPIPCQRLRRAHATYTPGTARAACRPPPG